MGFPGGSVVKNPPAKQKMAGSTSGSGRSTGEGNSKNTPVFLPVKSHKQRNLVGYSPRGHKVLDMT